MRKNIRILQIMQKEGCDWEEAVNREQERKRLTEYF